MKSNAITIGNDPRNRDEFLEIRQEVNKINHPDRPTVDWEQMEILCQKLFKKNGVDLQTAIYYTLARTKLAKLAGFTEGCELLASLMAQAWHEMWPKPAHARADMLEWLNGRISPDVRYFEIKTQDYPLVERCKKALTTIKTTMTTHQLTPMPRIVFLLDFIEETNEKLEEVIAEQAAKPVEPPPTVVVPEPPKSPPPPKPKKASPPKMTPTPRPAPPKTAVPPPKAEPIKAVQQAVIIPVQSDMPKPPQAAQNNGEFWKGLCLGLVVGLLLGLFIGYLP